MCEIYVFQPEFRRYRSVYVYVYRCGNEADRLRAEAESETVCAVE